MDTRLPPEFASLDGEQAIAVYTEVAALRSQNETLAEENERLRGEVAAKDEKIERLNREVGKWQALYEMLKEPGD
jgi:predicted nuclease with TOPRIM domain